MFLCTCKLKSSDVGNYIGPGLSYDAWCYLMACKWQELMFPYESLNDYKELSHVGPIVYEKIYGGLETTNSMSISSFWSSSRKMVAQQGVIGCKYTTFQTLVYLLRWLEKRLNKTVLAILMYAMTQIVSQLY